MAKRARENAEAAVMDAPMHGQRRVLDWFGERGWTPFPYQLETWAAYAAGLSGLVHAPTGTGKTYAVWGGPVAEYLDEAAAGFDDAADASPGLRVLWITPLRALASDTIEAMTDLARGVALDWRIESRTGDTSQALRRRQQEKLPPVLVTTPESLSLQLSYAEARERFAGLRCVIVDEWHELIGTKRGVQTELGLARLRNWSPRLRVWGLSATLGNLEEARDVLMGAAAPDGRTVLIRGQMPKAIEVQTVIPESVERFPWAGHLGISMLAEVIAAIESAATTLVFTNVRSQAEIWFRRILNERPDWLGQIGLHHGSLDRDVRERVEDGLKTGTLRAVVCTSSLDLGVDFTPVDQVIQVGSPRGVARLMQRAGRSGHQPGKTSRILCVPTHSMELIEFAAAREAAARREVESRTPIQRALDVLVQHLVTVALGGGFVEGDLLAEVRTSHAFKAVSDEEWRWCMEFVTGGGPVLKNYPQYARVVRGEDGVFRVTDKRIATLHRMSIGTITSDTALRVQYVHGKGLGTIEEGFISKLNPGDTFYFAGRVLELARVRQMTAFVRPATRRSGVVPTWNGGRFSLSTQLASAVRQKLDEARENWYGDPEMKAVRPLLEMQMAASSVPSPGELLIERTRSREGHHWFLFPFDGRQVHEGLGTLLAYRLAQQSPRSITATSNDYGFELLSVQEIEMSEADWRNALSTDGLVDDLLHCLNAAQMSRRQFRDIARIAGLIFQGYPGQAKPVRQLQASSELFFEVFRDFDPDNLLLDQARREVLEDQLEIRRLRATLERIADLKLRIVETPRLTPLAFPIWAERLRSQHVTSERWSDRVKRMAVSLERATLADRDRDVAEAPRPRRPRGAGVKATRL